MGPAAIGLPGIVVAGGGIVASQFVSSIASGFFAPAVLGTNQNAFWNSTWVLPSPEALLQAYRRGFLGEGNTKWALRKHGINFELPLGNQETNDDAARKQIWRGVYNSTKELPPLSLVVSMWSRGMLNEQHPGFRALWSNRGADLSDWEPLKEGLYDVPSVGLLMEARNRGVINQSQFDIGLKRNGFGQPFYRQVLDQLRSNIPSIVDQIHFAVKEAYSPQIAGPAGLYDKFPEQIARWGQALGFGGGPGFRITVDGREVDATWLHLWWAAHWQPFSATQVIEMFQRHRPGRVERFRVNGLNPVAVTQQTLDRWLQINDYPPELRDNLAALAFNPLRLTDIRAAITLNYRLNNDPVFARAMPADLRQRAAAYNRDWAVEQFLDRGVLPDDANTQVDIAISAAVYADQSPARSLRRSFQRQFFSNILRAYFTGVLTRERAAAGLSGLGLDAATVDNFLDLQEARRTMRTAEAVVRSARRGYLSGALSEANVEEWLQAGGIDPDATAEYIQQWRLEFNTTRRQATTAQILKWLAQGMLSLPQARARLANLGWLDPDTTILLAEAQSKALTLRAQSIRAADSDRRRRSAELEKVRRQAVQNLRAVQSAILRETPVTTLQRWVREGIINRNQFLRRLINAGFTEPVARGYLDDAFVADPGKAKAKSPSDQANDKDGIEGESQQPPATQPPPTPQQQPQPPEPQRVLTNETPAQALSVLPRVLNTPPRRLGDGQDGAGQGG